MGEPDGTEGQKEEAGLKKEAPGRGAEGLRATGAEGPRVTEDLDGGDKLPSVSPKAPALQVSSSESSGGQLSDLTPFFFTAEEVARVKKEAQPSIPLHKDRRVTGVALGSASQIDRRKKVNCNRTCLRYR